MGDAAVSGLHAIVVTVQHISGACANAIKVLAADDGAHCRWVSTRG
jgi:hypothetical protein